MSIWQKFWSWYNKHLLFNTGIAAFLFALQLVHLYWLSVHVVFHKVFGLSLWNPTPTLEWLLIFVDYTEIPALVTTSLVYINELRKKYNLKSVLYSKNTLYLIFLNSQFLHIFWITDEFVQSRLTGGPEATILPLWLAFLAIAIDYLELPVIFETIKKLFELLRKGGTIKKFQEVFQE